MKVKLNNNCLPKGLLTLPEQYEENYQSPCGNYYDVPYGVPDNPYEQ